MVRYLRVKLEGPFIIMLASVAGKAGKVLSMPMLHYVVNKAASTALGG